MSSPANRGNFETPVSSAFFVSWTQNKQFYSTKGCSTHITSQWAQTLEANQLTGAFITIRE